MTEHKIEQLQEVLSGRIEKNKKIKDTRIEVLTAPGENNGSVMLKLDIILKNEENGNEEEIYAVAKMLPTQEFVRKVLNVQVTFKNEMAMYDTIAPPLRNFQRENGVTDVIDCFPELYGARINLEEGNGTVDDNAVIILENLISKGYEVVDRYIGFDLETAKLILKDLAAFHAVPLALKLKRPEVFDKKIRPYLSEFQQPSLPNREEINAMIIDVLAESEICKPWIPKVKDIYKNLKVARKVSPKEPFLTMIHADLWINNTMVKFQNGIPVSNKLIDFQVCDYKSPARDVFFFLFSSVQLVVLQEHLDSLLEFYHEHFISHLEKLKCDITPFSYPKFLDEIISVLPVELSHSIAMVMFAVFGKKGGSPREFNPDKPPDFKEMLANTNPVATEKARHIIEICGKKEWL